MLISLFFAIAMLIAVCVWGVPRARHRWSLIACGMLIAGICGNLTDRIFRAPGPLRGHVVDFMSLPHFAVFNVADIFITSTAILVVVVAVFGHHEDDAG
ncbi:lipoprotein signal peptidase [Cutibacterium acnes JCM 18909]|nr:lipoprotein signal peptidase [Cutibacterium acnes JCM 18909]